MFEQKNKKLFDNEVVTKKENNFVNAGLKNSAKTTSENGALKYSTTGNDFVDQFSKLGNYKIPRSFKDISSDCELLWSQNKLYCVLFIFYIRMITRVVSLFDGVKTSVPQKGAELKHEGIMRMIWLYFKSSKTFWENIYIFVSIGSWKDVITMLSYDLQYNGWEKRKLDWNRFGSLILSGLENKNTSELLKKYLPSIKSKKECTTLESQADNLIGKWICSLLFGNSGEKSGSTYKSYRKLKSSGTAHEWQQLISQRKFDKIDFGKIHGRALSLLVKGKFLFNQGLSDKYNEWIKKDDVEVKYTGFVHELFDKLTIKTGENERLTIDKQFETIVKKAGEKPRTSLIVTRDTSNSMGSISNGTNMSCYNIAKALALYFSEFLTGEFQNSFIEFNSNAKFHKWKGSTPTEKWLNDKTSYVGSTNFLSVIELFVTILKSGVKESEFPSGILCISDSEFNPASLNKTNVDTAKVLLKKGGFSQEYVDNFIIVLWNLQSNGRGNKFETYGEVKNVFYFSGYSASTISFLDNKVKTAYELFEEAMNQEVFKLIKL